MIDATMTMYNIALGIMGVLLLCCLVRAIMGPRIADRIIAINMMGTLVVMIICILSYVMLSFLAVVLLTKIYMGVYREKRRREEEAKKHA